MSVNCRSTGRKGFDAKLSKLKIPSACKSCPGAPKSCPDKDEESFDYNYAYANGSSDDASSEGRSSLSSLTTNDNDLALGRSIQKQLVPTFDDRGRFSSFGRKGSTTGKREGPSPSPWYSSARAQQQQIAKNKKHLQSSPARSHATTELSSVATPPPAPIRPHQHSNSLGNDFMTSMEHIDSLVRYDCPSSTLPTKDDRIISSDDADSNNYATGNTYDTSMPSEVGFGTYVYSKFVDSSRRKKMLILLALVMVMLVICIAAAMAGAFGGKEQSGQEDGNNFVRKKNYKVEQVENEKETGRGTDNLTTYVPSDDYLDSGDGLDDEVDYILPVEYKRVPKPCSSPTEDADGSSIGVPTDDYDYLDSGDDLDDDEVDFILPRSKKSVPKPKKSSPTNKNANAPDDYQDSGDR